MTVLALDIGGSTVRGALISREGNFLSRHTVQTGDRDPRLRATRDMAETMLARARDRRVSVVAIGAGFPEYVGSDGLLTSHEVLDWERQPTDLLADLAPTVVVESDVRCAATAELTNSTTAFASFLFVSLGTGLSHTFVQNGRLHRGARGEAIAIGEMHVSCAHGLVSRASLEDYCSGAGLARRYTEATGQDLRDEARSLFALASQGDMMAGEVLDSGGRALGTGIAQAVALLDPEVVVMGGGLGTAEGRFSRALHNQYARDTARRPNPPRLVTSSFGADAGLLGAGLMAWSATMGAGPCE